MCGIFGQLSVEPLGAESFRGFLDRAAETLRHRGPDAEGRWSDHFCSLGHTRLSVIDLSSGGAQPMLSHTGQTVLTFNGEVYNFLELRSVAPVPEGGWRSHSDTEILLEHLERHGLDGLKDVQGMFAFATWRPKTRELWLVRDRIGKKPLYYRRIGSGGLLFASEVQALLPTSPDRPATTLDRVAEFLQHGYVAAPRTGFVGIELLPPSCVLRATVANGSLDIQLHRYWAPGNGLEPVTSREQWDEEFDSLLKDAVRVRLRSDVPLGTFLSGGVDSSVVSLLASDQLGQQLRTYTVDFAEEDFSEGAYAAEVARALGSRHTGLGLQSTSIEEVGALVETYGDLHGDSSALPTMAICRAARRHETVVLSGDGGDELLGGYARYWITIRNVEVSRQLGKSTSALLRAGARVLPWWLRGLSRLGRLSSDGATSYSREMMSYGPRRWPPILRPSSSLQWPDFIFESMRGNRNRPLLFAMMRTDLRTYLPNDVLVKVDRASMRVALEVRSPFLDHRLFEHVARARAEWLVDQQGTKAPLRRLYASRLPAAVFNRRKMGFGVPLRKWFRGSTLVGLQQRLLGPTSCLTEIVDVAAVRRLFWSHATGQRDESFRLWHLLVLDEWLRRWAPTFLTSPAADRSDNTSLVIPNEDASQSLSPALPT